MKTKYIIKNCGHEEEIWDTNGYCASIYFEKYMDKTYDFDLTFVVHGTLHEEEPIAPIHAAALIAAASNHIPFSFIN